MNQCLFLSLPHHTTQVCNAMCLCNPRCVSWNFRVFEIQMGPKHAICAVRHASQKITFAMRCIFTVVCALAAGIHCGVGHDANITASAMLRYGELRCFKGAHLNIIFALMHVPSSSSCKCSQGTAQRVFPGACRFSVFVPSAPCGPRLTLNLAKLGLVWARLGT